MSTFNFAQTFNQSFQSSLDRAQQRRRQRALNQIRMRRINERARRHQAQRELERLQMILGNRADRQERRRTTVEMPVSMFPGLQGDGTIRVSPEVAAELKEKSQTEPRETIEVKRQNIPSLPGSGPANVDPDTLIRHGLRDEASGKDGDTADGGGGASTSGVNPSTAEEARKALRGYLQQEQKAADAGASKDSLASIQDRINASKTALDSLTDGRPNFFQLRQQAMSDTSRTDTTRTDTTDTRPDTTGTDSTRAATMRGLGRTPGFATAPELGVTTGGGGGGGTTDPQEPIGLLRSPLGDYSDTETETLVEAAHQVAFERSPQEAQRRLDTLVQGGRLDPARRDSIIREVERKRQAALDGLQGLRGGQ